MRQLVYTSLRLIIMPHFTKENLPNHQKVSKYYQHDCSLFILHKTCSKQYAEETTDHFRLRWNNSKTNDRKFKRGEHCMQEHLYQHFYSDGHNGFLKDVKIMLINKTDCKDPKNRENYWVRTFKMLAPDGLKI